MKENYEVSFTEEMWYDKKEIKPDLKEKLKKDITSNIGKVVSALRLMKQFDFIWSMDITSKIVVHRTDGEVEFYHYQICRETPQTIDVLVVGPEGTDCLAALSVSVKLNLVLEQAELEDLPL